MFWKFESWVSNLAGRRRVRKMRDNAEINLGEEDILCCALDLTSKQSLYSAACDQLGGILGGDQAFRQVQADMI